MEEKGKDMTEAAAQSLRQQRREKRRREILEAALELFAAQGYHGASMEEIAEAALLTRAGLYRYYSDKPSLLNALRRWKVLELTQRSVGRLGKAKEFAAQLRAVIRETLAFQEENPGFFRILFTAGTLPELAEDDAFAPYSSLLLQILAGGVKEGAVTTDFPSEELAMILASLIFKNLIKRNLLGFTPTKRLEQDAELIERVFLEGAASKS